MKKLLFGLLLLALPAFGQQATCVDTTLSATGRTEIAIPGGSSRYVAANFSYRTTGSPTGVSISIDAGNAPTVATQTPFEQIAAVTNTTGANMGKANGPFRHWYANVGTLSGGTTPTIILTSCFNAGTLISLTGPTGVVTGSGTAGQPAVWDGTNSIQASPAVRFADQFTGADAGAKIAAAIADLPATGGTVDARGLEGAQTVSATVTIPTNATVILGAETLTGGASANPIFSIADAGTLSFSAGTVLTPNGSNLAWSGDGSVFFNTGNLRMESTDVAVGGEAMQTQEQGQSAGNVAVGFQALTLNETAANQTALGSYALRSSVTNGGNTAVGSLALELLATGSDNVAVGYEAFKTATNSSSSTAVGGGALKVNTTGTQNTAVGAHALVSNTTGSDNTAIGFDAMTSNQDGINNVAVGNFALNNNVSGVDQTAVGNAALYYTTGGWNTGIGFNAGVTGTAANANTTGQFNTFIGYNSGPGSTTQLTGATAIGVGSLVNQDFAVVLGDPTNAATAVGIGTQTPATELDVNGTTRSSLYATTTNCADPAGAAACGAAPAGAVVIDASATTVVVSTTAVTANSRIFIQEAPYLSTELSITCNTTTGRLYTVTALTAATSFTVTASAAPVTNPACLNYIIFN